MPGHKVGRSLRLFKILAIRALSEENNIEMESKLKIEYYSPRTYLGRCVPTKNIVQILKRNECCRSISIIKVFRRPKYNHLNRLPRSAVRGLLNFFSTFRLILHSRDFSSKQFRLLPVGKNATA